MTQPYDIRITSIAEYDLEAIGDYIAYKLLNPTAAENTVKGIRKQVNKLSEFPERCEPDEDPVLASKGVRKTYYKDYKIYFTIEETMKTVFVIRILHMLVDSKTALYHTLKIVE